MYFLCFSQGPGFVASGTVDSSQMAHCAPLIYRTSSSVTTIDSNAENAVLCLSQPLLGPRVVVTRASTICATHCSRDWGLQLPTRQLSSWIRPRDHSHRSPMTQLLSQQVALSVVCNQFSCHKVYNLYINYSLVDKVPLSHY